MFEKTGFRTSGLKHIPLKTALEGIVNAEFQTVEFCLEHPEASLSTIELAGRMGLGISSVSYHGKRDGPVTRLKFGKRAIRMAAESMVDVVVLGSPLRDRENFLREATDLYDMCCRLGVKPAWETEPDTVLDGIDEFNMHIVPLGPLAGINLDAGHLHLQERCTVENIKVLGDRIFHVHVEGMSRSEHTHLIPDKGNMVWQDLFSGLAQARYGGSLTIDLFDLPADWRGYLQRANIALNTRINYYKHHQILC
ncbi:MAG: sugar phosphate isomerase/epimerase [Candidatus Aegiribacteria sp.]|nr:sugar phosphate isomerase/epimerase [Candidatus Aegiribacteria sp.]